MKAISLHQPWAQLMMLGAKRIETRSWATDVRGWVLIHAALKWTRAQQEMVADWPEECRAGLATGAVVGAVRIKDCVQVKKTRITDSGLLEISTAGLIGYTASKEEIEYGDYTPGRWAWITDAFVRFESPIAYRGRQRWFDVEDYLIPGEALAAMMGANAGRAADEMYEAAVHDWAERKDG